MSASAQRDDRLTILLPLRGRHLHTLRFLFHADSVALPHPILIADGMVHPQLAALLENRPDLFPNLCYTYLRYPDDATLPDFYRKMADAASRVTTPYVMQTDNDDFLLVQGLQSCIDYLDAHPDYVSCGAHIPGFSLAPASDRTWLNLTGKIDFLMGSYGAEALSEKSSPRAGDRVQIGAADGRTIHIYYDVIRSSALATTLREVAELNPADLMVHNRYIDHRASTLGKRHFAAGAAQYLRQFHTSLQISEVPNKDIVTRLLRDNVMAEHEVVAKRIAQLCKQADGPDADEEGVAQALRASFAKYVSALIADEFRPPIRRRVPASLRLPLRRFRVSRRFTTAGMRQVMAAKLRASDPRGGATFRHDLAAVDSVLESGAFPAFVKAHAAFLLDGP